MMISLIDRSLHYELEFSGKFNLITGMSGSKKTALLRSLLKYKRGIKSVTCNINLNGVKLNKNEVFLFSNVSDSISSYEYTMMSHSGCLFIIDESSDIFTDRKVSSVLKESNNYFLIIGRISFGWLPLSIDSIYEFKEDRNRVYNAPVYADRNSDLTKIETVDFILTEDSRSSRLFFKHHFNCNVCDEQYVIDGRLITMDNSQLHIVLNHILKTTENVLVVFDASAYGFFYDLLVKVINNNKNKGISILAWDSYESYLLSCPPFQKEITKDTIKCDYNSIEQYSFKLLQTKLKGYTKSRFLNKLKDQCFIQSPLTSAGLKRRSGVT